jgi:ABC-type nickel/cobalt efflux system permease component RcnA
MPSGDDMSRASPWLERVVIGLCLGFALWWLQNQWQAFADFKDQVNEQLASRRELMAHEALDAHPGTAARLGRLEGDVQARLRRIEEDLREIKADLKTVLRGAGDGG